MISKKVLERWSKDYKLPIKIFSEPYFSYFVDLFDSQHNVKQKLELLEYTLSCYETDDDFLNDYYKIRDNIIKHLNEKESYKTFINEDFSKYNVNNKYSSNNVFNNSNKDCILISIDLVKANFQVLKYFYPDIVDYKDTYKDFLKQFTDLEYMMQSKYLRQVIFGNINPKRQVKLQRYLIEQIINLYDEEFKSKIISVSNDEIVIKVENNSKFLSFDFTEEIKDKLNIDVDVEIYLLKQIVSFDKKQEFYVKEFINKDGYELMSVPANYYTQVFKYYNDMQINDNDLLFLHEGLIAKFLNSIFN